VSFDCHSPPCAWAMDNEQLLQIMDSCSWSGSRSATRLNGATKGVCHGSAYHSSGQTEEITPKKTPF
jgi:hypothetical protein